MIFLCVMLKHYLLDLVVTEEMKTWTEGIMGAQWNESNWCLTEDVLWSENIHQKKDLITYQTEYSYYRQLMSD